MSTSFEYDPADLDKHPIQRTVSPRPLASALTAAASRLKNTAVTRAGTSSKSDGAGWQEDAWDMYDLVGEQRFLATTLANRISQAHLFVGRLPDVPTEDVEPLTEGPIHDVFETMNGHGRSLNQMMGRMGLNLFVAGEGYFVGLPKDADEDQNDTSRSNGLTPFGQQAETSIDMADLDWRMFSASEVRIDSTSDEVKIDGLPGRDTFKRDEIYLIRVWRAHPRYWLKADSPTRSSLPVLRELVGLTMHISAQVDSRLAGAGVLLIPQEADRAIRAASGVAAEEGAPSPLVEAIVEAMITPIGDRSSAAAVVPIMPVVPGDTIDQFRFMSFSTPLDSEARSLRDEAIRRLALGQDCPPELLLGMAGMNHWGAWLVREDVVTTHVEPPLAMICDALTTEFLWPVLLEQGMDEDEVRQHVIWYDVSHLITRPNQMQDAKDLHSAKVLSDRALREAGGFDEIDAPDAAKTVDPVLEQVLAMVSQAPSLASVPGLIPLYEQLKALYSGNLEGAPDPDPDEGAAGDIEEVVDDAEEEDEAEGGDTLPEQDESDGPAEAAQPPNLSASISGPVEETSAGDLTMGRVPPVFVDYTHKGGDGL